MTEAPAFEASAYRIGDIDLLTIPDGRRSFPLPDGFVRNANRAEINRALAEAGMPRDEMTIVFNPVLLRMVNRYVLVDTGNGEASSSPGGGTGLLLTNLALAGIAPEQIDLVIISHFHGDHINGLVRANGNLAFPNAAVSVPEREWAFWTSEDERARAQGGRLEAAFANVSRVLTPLRERIQYHRWDGEAAPGVVAAGTPGHTPGHTSYVVSSGGESLFIQGDVTNHPALFLRNPGWHAAFDIDAEMAETTRRRVYDMLATDRVPVQGFHFPLPARGYVEKDGDRYRLADGA